MTSICRPEHQSPSKNGSTPKNTEYGSSIVVYKEIKGQEREQIKLLTQYRG